MIALLRDIGQLWKEKIWFKVSSFYILLLILLVLVLDFLPLAYTPNQLDLQHTLLSPFQEQSAHVAGTDALGRDVLVNSLYGARTGLMIAVPVMLVSCILGTVIGATAGYYGNNLLKLSIGKVITGSFMLFCFLFYGIYIPLQSIALEMETEAILYSLLLLASIMLVLKYLVYPLLCKINLLKSELNAPLDKLVLRSIEILTSIPKLILILALASFITPSVFLLSLLLILTYWTGTARLARAEMLRIKELPFIEAAQSLGLAHRSIILKEALPNLSGPVIVAFTFGVAGLLAVEATLSFLGIGLPATIPSWGRMIAGIRSNTTAWWLVVVPSSFLTLTALSFQVCSHYILKSLQEKKTF